MPAGTFKASLRREWLATLDDVQAGIGKAKILDARTVSEMDGSDTRLSSRGGVIPSAIPVYWEDLLDSETKTFKSADELRAIYEAHGIRPSDNVIAYCWVGHRSSVDLFALHLIGYDHLRNYLGSWEEWSRRMDLPDGTVQEVVAGRTYFAQRGSFFCSVAICSSVSGTAVQPGPPPQMSSDFVAPE